MKIALIGRSELLFNTALALQEEGHDIRVMITSKAWPEYQVTEEDFKKLSERIGCDYFYAANVNDKKFIEDAKKRQIDIGISVNHPTVITQAYLDAYQFGILNAHAGDLPRFRGNACPNWAILMGEPSMALTIYRMEGNQLDLGDILAQEKFLLGPHTYIGDVYTWLKEAAPRLFLQTLGHISKNPSYVLKKKSDLGSDGFRCYPRIPSDSEINWSGSAEDIHRLIRASSEPFSGAYTFYQDKKLFVWRAELLNDGEKYLAVPGQIAQRDKQTGDVIVITGKGKLKLTEVSWVGEERTHPVDFITSFRIRLGKGSGSERFVKEWDTKSRIAAS